MSNAGNIAFIVGTGRCGTTMLAQMLNAHSNICVPHELQLIFGYCGNGPRFHELFSSGENLQWHAENFIRKVEELCPHKFEEFFDYGSFFRHQKYPIKNLSRLLNDLYHTIAASRGKEIFIEQTPWYGQRLDIMKELFPDAKFIHMIRDGRDVALSFSRTPWWHDSFMENLDRWQREATKISHDAALLLGKNQYFEVKYEDYVLDPEGTLRLIVDFLGVSFEKEMLLPENFIDYAVFRKFDGSSIPSNAYKNWFAKKEQAVFSDNVYGWRKTDPEAFANISSQARTALAEFGYEA
jgi:sulfotransferase family protein